MRLQRAGHEGGRAEVEGEDRHCAARRRKVPGLALLGARGGQRRHGRDQQPIQRHCDEEIDGGPDQAGFAPAEGVLEPGRGGPADGAGEPCKQRNAGDRGARLAAIKAGQRGEGCVVEPHRHADPEQEPGDRQAQDALRQPERGEPGRQHEVREGQHGAAAMPVDDRSDVRPDDRLQQQCRREHREKRACREAEPRRDRASQHRRQVIARCPGECLRRPERRDHDGFRTAQRSLPKFGKTRHTKPVNRSVPSSSRLVGTS